MRRSRLFFAIVLGLAGLPCVAGTALAGFNVCNKTGQDVRAALGRFDGTGWTSEGWWTVKAGSCTALLTGPLQGRFYYLYATDGASGTWDGKTRFCVAPEKRFKSAGRADCAKRGFDRRGFFEVDTGKKPDWTQTLSN
jgi:uncharacterized membrane protein